MWLSQAWNRGSVRMRKIFSGLRTITGWDHPFSASSGVLLPKDDYTKPTSLEGQLSLPLPRAEVSTTTAMPSISKWRIPMTKDG